jgi:DsbC/DsbD-like thiol-disulfide interchange protein
MMQLLLSLTLLLSMPKHPATWSFAAVATEGDKVEVTLTAQLEEGWHLYATELPSDQGPIATSFRFSPSEAFTAGKLVEPAPKEEFDPNFAMVVRHHSGAPVFKLPIVRRTADAFTVEGELEFMVCNDKTCLPPEVVKFQIPVPAR